MNNTNNVTDIEFTEVPKAADTIPNPVFFLTEALYAGGYVHPEDWKKDLNPQAETAETIDERLFLTNRSLALYLSEQQDIGDTIIPRMFISEKQSYENWTKIITEGIVPWLLKQFDAHGKRIGAPNVVTAEGVDERQTVGSLVSEDITLEGFVSAPATWSSEMGATQKFEPSNDRIADEDGKLVEVNPVVENDVSPTSLIVECDENNKVIDVFVSDVGIECNKDGQVYPRGQTPSIVHYDELGVHEVKLDMAIIGSPPEIVNSLPTIKGDGGLSEIEGLEYVRGCVADSWPVEPVNGSDDEAV